MKTLTLPFLLVALLISGCAKRNLTYFSDIEPNSNYSIAVREVSEIRIKPFDRVRITVNSPSTEANLLFNRGKVAENIETINGLEIRQESTDQNIYLVGKEGFIEFPILGQIKLQGLTLHEAREELKFLLKSQVKEPSVNLIITNFKVTVIGEVNRPSNFLVGSERINIFEAIGLAGDLTLYGKRENVLIMRDIEGVRNVYRVNLNNKDILNSPYYYLQQNDIIYVEPHGQKEKDAKNNSTLITVLSVASSVLVAIIFNYQNLFN
ncbi:polysaccharide export outer membrane protein [Belliella buryatensis]|jgi:polysaccharide biosynthesis/export protein|uniref:Polysaccharide export outer membrane protein n=1 Tax=Belliella buryatensis TaxID=1500549 RepID=A0A239BK05_9BACT|nr:polysaccharide biosynthesis/export family protein [Belliella buryatensis]SNS07708.1 polysaccharide export outer membrane protein [Belliella buryatensis]